MGQNMWTFIMSVVRRRKSEDLEAA